MKRLLFRIVVLVLLLVVVGGLALGMVADGLVKTGVEEGGSAAMGVETRLDSADIGILGGTLRLSGLNVSNPQGFDGEFLKLGQGDVEVSLRSLLSDTIEVPNFRLENLEVTLLKIGGDSNFETILDHMGGGGGGGAPAEQESGGKGYVIRNLELKNVTAKVSIGLAGQELTATEITIPMIQLKDVGSNSDSGVVLKQLIQTLVQAVLQSVAENGISLPADFLGDLKGQLSSFQGNLQQSGYQVVGEVTQQVQQQVGEVLEGLPGDAGKKVQEELGKKIGDLLPGGKRD